MCTASELKRQSERRTQQLRARRKCWPSADALSLCLLVFTHKACTCHLREVNWTIAFSVEVHYQTQRGSTPCLSEWVLMDTACQEMLSSKWLKKVYQQLNAQALQAWQIWRKETLNRAVNGRFITVMSADGYLKKNVKPTLRIASRRGSGPISALSGSYVDIKRITLSIKQHEKEFVKSRTAVVRNLWLWSNL